MDADEKIKEAVRMARAGDKAGARVILKKYVIENPDNEIAWWLLAQIAQEKDHAIYCLNQIVKINPNNTKARERLFKLSASSAGKKMSKKESLHLLVAIGYHCFWGLQLSLF